MPLTVADLVRAGRLESVPVDRSTAVARLRRAEQHLVTAAALLGQDDDVAYGSLYDAARKAVTAHMLAHGLRVTAQQERVRRHRHGRAGRAARSAVRP